MAGLPAHIPSTIRPCFAVHSVVTRLRRGELSSTKAKPFSFQLHSQKHPSVLARDQLLFPASTAPGSCTAALRGPTRNQPTPCPPASPLPASAQCELRGTPSKKTEGSLLLFLDAKSLYTVSLAASSQPVSSISFCNMKLLNKHDKCPLPMRAMPKTVSRSLTAKVILFVKKKGKHYH